MTTADPNRAEPSTIWQTVGVAVPSCLNLLQGVAQATNQLLTTGDHATAINQTLATLGQVTGVDRVYIFEIHSHPETAEPAMSQRFEWARETVTAEIDNPKLQNLTYAACSMDRLHEALQAGQSCSGLVRDLSAIERELLEPQGIVSILIVPILVNGRLWGLLGFDDCHCERHWAKEESAILMTMAAMIGSCIAQRQTEDALRQSQLRLEQIAANVPGMIFQFLQGSDGSRCVPYASSGCRELFELEPEEIQAYYQVLSNLTHPDDRNAFEQSVAASAATEATWHWEGRIVTRSGKVKWIQGASRPERQLTGDLLWNGLVVDITDRKQVEADLRASEERLQSFFDATFESVVIHDRGKILDVNYATEALYGYSRAELIDHSVLEVTAPCSQELIQRRAQFPSDQPFEAIGLRKDGTTFVAEVSAKSISYQGRLARVAGVRDITDRKQAEEALRQSETRNRALLNAIPDLIFRFGRDGTYLDCQAENVSDLLAPATELIGKKLDEVIPEPVAQLFLQHMEQALSTGITQTVEYELPVKGNQRYWETRLVVCGQDEVLAIVRDITERKRAEQDRQLSAERDRLLAQIALRIRQSLNLDQILHTTVAEVRQFLGCDRVFITCIDEQLQGNVAAESLAPDWESVLGLLGCNPTYIRELRALFESGNVQVINDTATAEISPLRLQYFARYHVKACMAVPIMLNDKLFGNLVVHQCDRTRQWQLFEVNLLQSLATQVAIAVQQAQLYQQVQALNTNLERQVQERTQQLEQKYTELQELNRLKDVFLYAVSHDLRTPVLGWLMVLKNLLNPQRSVISGQSKEQLNVDSNLSLQGTRREPPATLNGQLTIPVSRSILERMVQSCDRQLRLINSLLEVHASEVAGVVLKREPVQLGELVQVLVEDFEPLVVKNQVTLLNRVPADLPMINADPAQLRRVYENLLSNAFNHNPPGITLTLDAQVKKGMIYCTVADNGVGMSQEMCAHLFQLYFRGQDAQGQTQGHRPYTGLGLGLYLCRQIITAHGGEIGVNSRQGAGTTFWFTLPNLPIHDGGN
jgi:PAS domain S-box-containing protein